MRILLTGANGQVGRCIKQQKPEHWEMIAADSNTLDITDAKAVANMVSNFEPDAIINVAGYTNLEAAECDKEHVFAVNAEGTRILAEAAARAGIRFIHLSSDYVFDGQKTHALHRKRLHQSAFYLRQIQISRRIIGVVQQPSQHYCALVLGVFRTR